MKQRVFRVLTMTFLLGHAPNQVYRYSKHGVYTPVQPHIIQTVEHYCLLTNLPSRTP